MEERSQHYFFQLLQSNTFLPPDTESPGSMYNKVPHVLIGDKTYTLNPVLMRTFPSRNLNAAIREK